MIRSLLVFVAIFGTFALAEESTAPAVAATSCDELVSKLRATDPSPEVQEVLLDKKRDLEIEIDRRARSNGQVLRRTQIQGVASFEAVLFALVGGSKNATNEILAIMRPLAYDLWDNYFVLAEAAGKIQKIKAQETRSENDLKELSNQENIFQTASIPFGQSYGQYMTLMTLIHSVAEGSGAKTLFNSRTNRERPPEIAKITKDDVQNAESDVRSAKAAVKPVNFYTLFDMTAPATVGVAKSVLEILDPGVETNWFSSRANHRRRPTQNELSTMFSHNIYALLAKLEQDLEREKADGAIWRRGIEGLATVYLSATDKLLPARVPEYVRVFLLRIAGIQYDRTMLKRFSGKIQTIVEVTRVRDPEGDFVLLTDDQVLEMQIAKLMEYSSTATGDDLLVTFARLAYHTPTWTNLVRAVKERADATRAFSQRYVDLYKRIQRAETKAASLPDLPYLGDVSSTDYTVFLSMQAGYFFAIQEVISGGRITGSAWRFLRSFGM